MELQDQLVSINTFLSDIIGDSQKEIVFTSSLSKEDQVVSFLMKESDFAVRYVTLDTGRHFPEYYDLIRRTESKWKIQFEVLSPNTSKIESWVKENGINAFYDSLELRKSCCGIRKIEPLKRALKGADLWITGLRKSQSENRSSMPLSEYDENFQILKYNPLLEWTDEQLDAFIDEHNIPINPLHNKGYMSIGCAPCTRAIAEGEHPRQGRWWWESSKKECGLHS